MQMNRLSNCDESNLIKSRKRLIPLDLGIAAGSIRSAYLKTHHTVSVMPNHQPQSFRQALPGGSSRLVSTRNGLISFEFFRGAAY